MTSQTLRGKVLLFTKTVIFVPFQGEDQRKLRFSIGSKNGSLRAARNLKRD